MMISIRSVGSFAGSLHGPEILFGIVGITFVVQQKCKCFLSFNDIVWNSVHSHYIMVDMAPHKAPTIRIAPTTAHNLNRELLRIIMCFRQVDKFAACGHNMDTENAPYRCNGPRCAGTTIVVRKVYLNAACRVCYERDPWSCPNNRSGPLLYSSGDPIEVNMPEKKTWISTRCAGRRV